MFKSIIVSAVLAIVLVGCKSTTPAPEAAKEDETKTTGDAKVPAAVAAPTTAPKEVKKAEEAPKPAEEGAKTL